MPLHFRERLGRALMGVQADEIMSVREMTAEITRIRLEWADTLDFIQHWAGRQAKRDAKAIKQRLGDPEPHAEEAAGPVQIDKSELRRRAALLRAGNGHHFPGSSNP